MRLLRQDEFKATMGEPTVAVGADDLPPFDFWPYVQAIPPQDLAGHDFSDGAVSHAWRLGDTYEHVLIRSETPNVFLVVVLDLPRFEVHGHHVLDLNELYGLANPTS